MHKIGEYIVYKKDTCIIKDIKEKHINGVNYYILSPISDQSLKIDVPVDSDQIRNLITKQQLNELIEKIPSINLIECNDKLIENEYKSLMLSGKHEDLIKIVKTTYLRNEERKNVKKKISEKDDYYFNRAEKYLYTEFSIILGMTYEETKSYIIGRLSK